MRMLHAVLNKSCWKNPTKQQLYGHFRPISKTIQVRRLKHTGHSWRNKDKLIHGILPRPLTHGCACVGRLAKTYMYQLCADTGFCQQELPGVMDNRDKCWDREREREREREGERERERESENSVLSVIYIYIYIYIYILIQKIQFSVSTQFNCQKHSISSYSV